MEYYQVRRLPRCVDTGHGGLGEEAGLCNDIATAVAFSTQKEQEESVSDQYSLTHSFAIYRKGESQL